MRYASAKGPGSLVKGHESPISNLLLRIRRIFFFLQKKDLTLLCLSTIMRKMRGLWSCQGQAYLEAQSRPIVVWVNSI